MQFLKFLSLLQKHGLSSAIFGISFPSQKMWTIICNLWNFIPKTWTMIRNSFLKKRRLSKAIPKISFLSPKTWTIICNFWNFFPFSKNMDYYMHFLEFLSKNMDYDKQFMEFLSLLQKNGLSYAISKISFPSPRTWTIRCNFWNFFPFSKNVDYPLEFMEFLSPYPKMWTIICIL